MAQAEEAQGTPHHEADLYDHEGRQANFQGGRVEGPPRGETQDTTARYSRAVRGDTWPLPVAGCRGPGHATRAYLDARSVVGRPQTEREERLVEALESALIGEFKP